jgi:hypothetical protein
MCWGTLNKLIFPTEVVLSRKKAPILWRSINRKGKLEGSLQKDISSLPREQQNAQKENPDIRVKHSL